MQYSTLLLGAIAVVGAAAQDTFRLSVEPVTPLNSNFYQVSWVNQGTSSLFAGDAKLNQAAEPFIFNFNNGTGSISFLSYHTERYQTFYVDRSETAPVQVNLWQGIPANASQSGFVINGGYVTIVGEQKPWILCPTEAGSRSYQLEYAGAGVPEGCIETQLKAQPFGLCN